jgi:mRNA interferase MazF
VGQDEVNLARGTIVLIDLNPTTGHEQQGLRPCVIVSDPDTAAEQRYPLVCVVPVSGTPGEGALYPPLAPGKSGLRKRSHALIDQLRSVDKRRVRRVFGRIGRTEMQAVDLGLCLYLGIEEIPPGPA